MSEQFFTKGIYGNGMVLQRECTNCIFGKAEKSSKITLSFRDINKSVFSDKNGDWKIEYNPGKAGGPFEMEIACENEKNRELIHFENIYVGEVWLSSGQSNAQLPMERLFYKYEEEFTLPENPFVRMITIPISYSFDGEKDSVENPAWICASAENLKKMSGTAYFFAKKLSAELKVPVGIINASQGGSPIESWMNEDCFKEMKKSSCLEKINRWRKAGEIEKVRNEVASSQKKWDTELYIEDKGNSDHWENLSFDEIKSKWEDCEIPGDLPDFGSDAGVLWLKKEIELSKNEAEILNSRKTHLWMGTIQDADKIWVNKEFCGVTYYTYPPRRYLVPKGAFVEGKNTVTIRIQKNGTGPIRFYKEKPYCIFTDDIKVQSSVTRNVELFKDKNAGSKGIKINLDGKWKKLESCKKEPRPGEMFFEWEPTTLYNSMLAPAFNYAIAGALWYQGESNAAFYRDYKDLLVKMAGLWREKFVYAPKEMPFVIAQLPNWADGHEEDFVLPVEDWAWLRQAEREAADELKNAALAVLIDAGEWNDLHPECKKTAGSRAADAALNLAYGFEKGFAPKVEYCQQDGNKIVIRFNCGKGVLKAYKLEKAFAGYKADFSCESSEVSGFELLNSDGTLTGVKAVLVSDTDVEVELPEKNHLGKELLYLWKNNPWAINLYSTERFPAAPFKIALE